MAESTYPVMEPRASSPEGDERHVQAVRYLQAGKGQKALEVLAQLSETYPNNEGLRSLIEEAKLRVKLDTRPRVHGRRKSQGNRALVYVLIVVSIATLAVLGVRSIRVQIAPSVAKAQAEQKLQQLLTEGEAFLQAGQLDDAEARFDEVLAQTPQDTRAQSGLSEVARQREVTALYDQALELQDAGESELALAKLMDLSVMAPQYRDVQLRIAAVTQTGILDQLYAEAESAYSEGQDELALEKYGELRQFDQQYKAELVASRLFDLHMRLGRVLLQQIPTRSESVEAALDHFTQALSLQPRHVEAAQEQRVAKLFLEGQTLYSEGYWDAAASRLRVVYEQRADYLGTTVMDMLYDAYIRSGDSHDLNLDLPFAYEQYRKAAELPVIDTTLAQSRLAVMALRLTPTPTPTVTPTATQTPLATMTPLPTALPTPRPLALYHNRILFLSEDDEGTALWAMDPKGKRERLGDSKSMLKEYVALVDKYAVSPDGRYRAYVGNVSGTAQIFLTRPPDAQGKTLPALQLTNLRVCYQPAWSPDGSQLVFVSEQDQTDDIWVMNVDGSNPRNLTENKWEWEKHPSWSPDGKRIVFWSNRDGRQQLYVMDSNGSGVKNISASETDDYDPVWVR